MDSMGTNPGVGGFSMNRPQQADAADLLGAVMDFTSDGIIIVGDSGRIIAHNQSLLQILEMPAGSWSGRDITDFLPSIPADIPVDAFRQHFPDPLTAASAGQQPPGGPGLLRPFPDRQRQDN